MTVPLSNAGGSDISVQLSCRDVVHMSCGAMSFGIICLAALCACLLYLLDPSRVIHCAIAHHSASSTKGTVGLINVQTSPSERCSDGGVGNALIHHSTIAECDHTHALILVLRHSQFASQGTGAVNVSNADMAMY
jgi:hypothetical protein